MLIASCVRGWCIFSASSRSMGSGRRNGLWPWLCCWVTLENWLPRCVPICEMGIRQCHTIARQVINRGLWLGFWDSPRGWEAHLFFTLQSRQVTQISLTLLSIKVRKRHSQKYLSCGKQAYEYVTLFSKYKWEQITKEAEMFGLVWLLH